MIAATHGNLVVSVTSGDGFFGLTLREKKLVKTKKMPRRGAGARKRRAEKRLLDRKRAENETESAEISNLEKDESDKPKLGESPSLSKNGTPTPEQNQMIKLVRDTVGLTQGDPNSSKAEGMQHLDDAASLDNHEVDPESSNAGDDQVRIAHQPVTPTDHRVIELRNGKSVTINKANIKRLEDERKRIKEFIDKKHRNHFGGGGSNSA